MKKHSQHRFGRFGDEMESEILPEIEKLNGNNDQEFQAKLAEISEDVNVLFSVYAHEFHRALAGFLTFHGTAELNKHEDQGISGAVVSMAINGQRIVSDMFNRAIDQAEHELVDSIASVEDDSADMIQDVLSFVVQVMDLDGWTESRGDSPLRDLFPSKPVA